MSNSPRALLEGCLSWLVKAGRGCTPQGKAGRAPESTRPSPPPPTNALGGRPLIHPSCWELRAPAVMETASMETRSSQRSWGGGGTDLGSPPVCLLCSDISPGAQVLDGMGLGREGEEFCRSVGSWHIKEGEFQGLEGVAERSGCLPCTRLTQEGPRFDPSVPLRPLSQG